MKRNEIIELACKYGAYFELDFPDTIRSVEISPEGFFSLIDTIIERHKVTQIKIPNDTMQQAFQSHWRLGYEAGKKAMKEGV